MRKGAGDLHGGKGGECLAAGEKGWAGARSVQARVLMFHKPKGVVVTASDELGRKTVYDLLPAWLRGEGWVPAGRLDRDSRGLLLFVREGRLVEALTRPGGLARIYEAEVRGHVQESQIPVLLDGVDTPAGHLRCSSAQILAYHGPKTRLRVVLDEGRNRHVRRLFGALRDERHGTPLKVLDLKRIAYGLVELDLPSGRWRFLEPREERSLISTTGR
ncbi:MAG: pseudouridine synthase [Acidobacteriota bacterium]